MHVLHLKNYLFGIAIGQLVASEPADSSAASDSTDLSSPKRQYFIAPRVGRSPSSSYLWPIGSAVGDNPPSGSELAAAAAFASQQQQQQQHHQVSNGNSLPRSTIIYLAAKRRLIGPRSGGLIPQARIGRRSSPISGLLPQPRVGRRSSQADEMLARSGQQQDEPSQQEVAVATLSDSSTYDALESLLSGR